MKQEMPDAEETIAYGIPTYRINGKNIVHFGGFKKHVSLFPGGSPLSDDLEKALSS